MIALFRDTACMGGVYELRNYLRLMWLSVQHDGEKYISCIASFLWIMWRLCKVA